MKSKIFIPITIIIIGIIIFFFIISNKNKSDNLENATIENKTAETTDNSNHANDDFVNIFTHINSFSSQSKYNSNLTINKYGIDQYPINLFKDNDPEITGFNVWANGDRKNYDCKGSDILAMSINSLTSATVTVYRQNGFSDQIILNFYNRFHENKTIEELAKEGFWSVNISFLDEHRIDTIDNKVEFEDSLLYSDLTNCLGDVSYVATYDTDINSLEDLKLKDTSSYLIWDYDSVVVSIECNGTRWGSLHKLFGKPEFNAQLNNVDKHIDPLKKIDKNSN